MTEDTDDRTPLTCQRRSEFGSTSRDQGNDEMTVSEAKQKRYEEWLRPLLAEFVAMVLFAFMHCMGRHSLPIADTAIINGFFVTIMVITIGHISGAHLNAAVTIAITLVGGLKWPLAPLYIIIQLVGSLCGAAIAKVALASSSGAFALGEGVSVGRGVLTETMMSILLVFAVLQSAVDLGSPTAAFAIGFSIIVGVLIGGDITGACMNPSLSLGPAVVSGAWENYWIYWIGPILGALVAVALYKLALASAKNRVTFRGNASKYEHN